MENKFSEWHNLIIDMDGVLWNGETALAGLVKCFDAIRSTGRRFVLATNNSGSTVAQHVEKLSRMGVQVSRREILTSALATTLYLGSRAGAGARVYAIGGDGVHHALLEHGFDIAETNVDYVVVGIDREISWKKLETAAQNIRDGATFVGTNPDVTYPTEDGIRIGNGAILAALQAATSVHPLIVGKPHPILYQQAMARMEGKTDDTLAIGDRLETDILGAQQVGISSLLVLTGVTSNDMLAASKIQPTCVLPGMPELTSKLLEHTVSGVR